MKREAATPPDCPTCSQTMIPVCYGFPSGEMFQAAERGEIVLGGCERQPEAWRCLRCKPEWVPPRPSAADMAAEYVRFGEDMRRTAALMAEGLAKEFAEISDAIRAGRLPHDGPKLVHRTSELTGFLERVWELLGEPGSPSAEGRTRAELRGRTSGEAKT